MVRRVVFTAICLVLLWASRGRTADASAAPRFDLDESAWTATHIVLATEGTTVDGRLKLVDIWSGRRAEADEIQLPRLGAVARDAMRRAHKGLRVTGERMVLFLDLTYDPRARQWSGAPTLDAASICWIEDGAAYAMIGRGSREGPLIGRVSMVGRMGVAVSEAALKARLLHLVSLRAELARLREMKDIEARLTGAAALVSVHDRVAWRDVFALLVTCGKAAVPVLVSHLDTQLWIEACGALGDIGDPSAVGPLVRRIEQELVFWREAKTRLKDGSWQQTSPRERGAYEARVFRLHTLLYTLRKMPSKGYVEVVQRTRLLWTEPPAFREIPYGHIERACDAALGAIETDDQSVSK